MLAIKILDDIAIFSRRVGASWHELGQVALRSEDMVVARQRVRSLLCKARAADVVLCLPPELSLRAGIELPLAAAENLREVLSFEMDRYTPFKAEEVYFDCRLVDSNAGSKRLKAGVLVIPRFVADPVLDILRSWGVNPNYVGVTTNDDRKVDYIDLRSFATNPTGARRKRNVSAALAACTSALLIFGVHLLLGQQQRELAALDQRLGGARNEFAEIDKLRQQLVGVYDRNRFLVDRKQTHPLVTELVAELTRLLPDNTWIVQLTLRDRTLALTGYSASASALIGVLEQSDLLQGIHFSSPVMLDASIGAERFDISASVVVTDGEPL